MTTRIEHDLLGERHIPADAYWAFTHYAPPKTLIFRTKPFQIYLNWCVVW